MKVEQIATLINSVTSEIMGENALITEDLSNVVDVGTTVLNGGDNMVDAYVRNLVNHIGRVIFVNREYRGGAPSVLMDGWKYGSILEKVSAEIPEAEENENWSLVDGTSYDPNVFHKPVVESKFYNSRVTYEVTQSIARGQVEQSFSGPDQLNGFLSMLTSNVQKSMTVKTDGLIMRTINALTAETLYNHYNSGTTFTGAGGTRAVNLLYLYNAAYPSETPLTASAALTNPDFIRYASFVMGTYVSRLSSMSSLFNIGGKLRFTPRDMLHVVLHADFEQAAATFLQSNTFNKELVSLPRSEKVPFWQGSGTGYDFADTSAIKVTTPASHTVTASGILGVMFDRDALGVCNLDRRVTTQYNAKADFWNNFHKFTAGYFNDHNENFVVFFVA